jgi:hypothetical protein
MKYKRTRPTESRARPDESLQTESGFNLDYPLLLLSLQTIPLLVEIGRDNYASDLVKRITGGFRRIAAVGLSRAARPDGLNTSLTVVDKCHCERQSELRCVRPSSPVTGMFGRALFTPELIAI